MSVKRSKVMHGITRKLDDAEYSYCKQELGVDVLLPMKKSMNIWEDAWALGQ